MSAWYLPPGGLSVPRLVDLVMDYEDDPHVEYRDRDTGKLYRVSRRAVYPSFAEARVAAVTAALENVRSCRNALSTAEDRLHYLTVVLNPET